MILTESDKRQVTLLCFAETILVQIANQQQPKTRRHSRLLAAIEQVKKADETYVGYLPQSYQDKAESILAEVEAQIDRLFE